MKYVRKRTIYMMAGPVVDEVLSESDASVSSSAPPQLSEQKEEVAIVDSQKDTFKYCCPRNQQ